ncbi:hypothetical protein [Bacillus vallismortis]|uniref:hypothetical protein n=1 Tax=Bacillus vallismortis TaxID=72361 RepID=UPI00227F32DE|nr:hypothetical protein [Bacillus vallismortis]MCY7918895.1 hypothetical protein [Bacillus vallismortis]MCY8535562.1 hypothetical protein [Bacillus vallismortis]
MDKIVQGSKDLFEKALKHMERYMQVRDDFLENDIVQLIGDSSKIVGFLRGSSELIIRKKFESFLKGFSLEQEPTEAQLEKLIKYIDNETKAEFIADSFSKILLAQSSKACMIMGSILNDILANKDNLSHEHLTCFNVLLNFYDMDIGNFKLLHFALTERRKANWESLNFVLRDTYYEHSSLFITLEKSISNQIIIRDIETTRRNRKTEVKNEEYYRLTRSGKLLGSYVNRIFGTNLAE